MKTVNNIRKKKGLSTHRHLLHSVCDLCDTSCKGVSNYLFAVSKPSLKGLCRSNVWLFVQTRGAIINYIFIFQKILFTPDNLQHITCDKDELSNILIPQEPNGTEQLVGWI